MNSDRIDKTAVPRGNGGHFALHAAVQKRYTIALAAEDPREIEDRPPAVFTVLFRRRRPILRIARVADAVAVYVRLTRI